MVTLEDRDGIGTIGLIAVDPEREKRGLGRSLVQAAQSWFAKEGFEQGRVVTQAANAAACRLYEKCGYSLVKTEHFYHFWI
jgi:dTDP-4-amino-4,6-dideoxy-D-galactose acyltransferase